MPCTAPPAPRTKAPVAALLVLALLLFAGQAVDGYAVFFSSSPHVVGSSTLTVQGEYSRSVSMTALPLDETLYLGQIALDTDPRKARSQEVGLNQGMSESQWLTSFYVAFFSRAADPEGLSYWLNQVSQGPLDMAGVAENFALATEAKAIYPYFNAPESATDMERATFIRAVYQNLFNRDVPENDQDVRYWVEMLHTGRTTPGLVIGNMIYAAIQLDGTDWLTIWNKIQVAEYFSERFEAYDQEWEDSDHDMAQQVLQGITDNPAIVAAGIGKVDHLLQEMRIDDLKRLLPESLYNTLTAGSRNNPGCIEHFNWQALGLPGGPNGQWYYTYENMIQGMASLANFANEGDENRRKLEIAAFLANVAQETGTHDPGDSYGGPGCYIQEGSGVYWKSENCGAVAPSGAGYCGRGPHQLTWAVNYRDFGRDVGVGDAYLNDPDILTKNPAVGIMGSIWFWGRTEYTDQSGAIPFKPAAHDVATGNWTPTEKDIACGRTSANFGVIINLINGGLECGASATGPGRQGALNRVRYLQSIAQAMDVVIPDGFIDDCENQQNFRDCTSF